MSFPLSYFPFQCLLQLILTILWDVQLKVSFPLQALSQQPLRLSPKNVSENTGIEKKNKDLGNFLTCGC